MRSRDHYGLQETAAYDSSSCCYPLFQPDQRDKTTKPYPSVLKKELHIHDALSEETGD